MKIFLVICAHILLLSIVLCQNKVHVAIYYESLCGDSLHFIKNQLELDYFQHFEPFIDIEFVPFGKAQSYWHGNSLRFICQHGPYECIGNKIHSCALHEAPTQAAQVKFVACQFLFGYKHFDLCARRAQLSYENILRCISGEIGTKLQLETEVKTKQLAAPRNMLTFIPQIVYNHKYDAVKQIRSLYNFRNVMCEEIQSISYQLPTICTK